MKKKLNKILKNIRKFILSNKEYFHNTVFKIPLKKDKRRSSILSRYNKTKQRWLHEKNNTYNFITYS